MRIAIAASLLKSITVESTGGTEAFAHILTEGLVNKGHDVTLFATSDSKTKAKLVSVTSSVQITGKYEGNMELLAPYQQMQASNIIKQSKEFDIIHNNYFRFYQVSLLAPFTDVPILTTMHNHFWHMPNLRRILTNSQRKGIDMVVFSSKASQSMVNNAFDSTVIYHGIDTTPFPFSSTSQDYVLFFSRLIPAKGIKDAIDAALMGHFPLHIAGGAAVLPDDIEFIEKNVTPYYSKKIVYIGSPDEAERAKLYQNARVLLFPTQLEEQFGFVAVEAMACGTPVIAYNRGAVSEVIEDGVTGFIIDPDDVPRPGKGSWIIKKQGIAGIIEAVQRINEIDRVACRARVEKYFTQERMVGNYIALYKRMLNK
jgi:glycosyltransferase involved in cell wall biosynthesis